jgi:hypothetical protein
MEGLGRDGGHGAVEPHDAARMRISDADRHQVSEVLRQAAGEGRIDLEELEERLEATYQAKTYADLVPITVDLPVQPAHAEAAVPRPASAPAGPAYASSVAIMSETKRLGPWQVQDGHTAFALMGSVLLDLRQARLAAHEVTITANAVMGEVKVLVDAGTVVVVEGLGIMGEFGEQRARVDPEITAGSPVVRLKGVALMGSVTVKRKAPSREQRRRLGG